MTLKRTFKNTEYPRGKLTSGFCFRKQPLRYFVVGFDGEWTLLYIRAEKKDSPNDC